ncbi:hypothetical protein [Rheinheimera sp.]|uniref:hypothetical protein n=1 Tax=Rheinheimera sp. TaxID=1869214 RepID=UPI002FDE2D17
MKNLMLSLIPFLSFFSVADVQTTAYGKNNYCEVTYENNSSALNSMQNGKKLKSILLEKNVKLSKFRSKHYCVLIDDATKSVSFFNKQTGELFSFKNFSSVEESPDGDFVAIAEKSLKENNEYISKITLLSKKGKFSINKNFDEVIQPSDFYMIFSYDSNFLNFYGVKDGEISYNTIDLKKSKVYSNLASNELTYDRWLAGQVEQNFSFTGHYPINNNEYVAKTNLGDILYVVNNDIVWKVTPKSNVSTTAILAVGSIYVVAKSPDEGLVLYRKIDGKKFNVISENNLNISSDEIIFKTDFKSSNIVIIYAKDMEANHVKVYKLNLNNKKMKIMDEKENCGFDLDC